MPETSQTESPVGFKPPIRPPPLNTAKYAESDVVSPPVPSPVVNRSAPTTTTISTPPKTNAFGFQRRQGTSPVVQAVKDVANVLSSPPAEYTAYQAESHAYQGLKASIPSADVGSSLKAQYDVLVKQAGEVDLANQQAVDAFNLKVTAYNMQRESYNAQVQAYNASLTAFQTKYPSYAADLMKPSPSPNWLQEQANKIAVNPITTQVTSVALLAGIMIVAPEFLPVTAPQILASAGIGVGISEGVNLVFTGKPLPPEQILPTAVFSAGLSVLGAGVSGGLAKVAPSVIQSFAGRAAVKALLSGGIGYVMSGGQPLAAAEGLVFGAAMSVGSEIVPMPHLGEVTIPLEGGDEAVWRGIYISKGESVYGSLGWWSGDLEGEIPSVGSEEGGRYGFRPITAIEATKTIELMRDLGYPEESIQTVKDVRSLLGITENIKSKYIQDILPQETETLSEAGVAVVKDYLVTQEPVVSELYGSFGARNQLMTDAEFVSPEGISGLRTPADIDIQLKIGGEQAADFVKGLLENLQSAGETVRISAESPTLIESMSESGAWRHAVDIHAVTDTSDLVEEEWGFKLAKEPTKIEDIDVQSLGEQGLRKGTGVLRFQEDMTMGVAIAREKDVADFFQIQKTLLESTSNPIASWRGGKLLGSLAEYYGVENLADLPLSSRDVYGFAKPESAALSPFLLSPSILVSSQYSASLGLGVSPSLSPSMSKALLKPSPYVSPSLPSMLSPSILSPSILSPSKSSAAKSVGSVSPSPFLSSASPSKSLSPASSSLIPPAPYEKRRYKKVPKNFADEWFPRKAPIRTPSEVLREASLGLTMGFGSVKQKKTTGKPIPSMSSILMSRKPSRVSRSANSKPMNLGAGFTFGGFGLLGSTKSRKKTTRKTRRRR